MGQVSSIVNLYRWNMQFMFINLPYMGFIRASGQDAAKFLQGQLTCNMDELTDSFSLLGAYCSQQGRVQATFRIFQLQSDFYLYLPQEIIADVITLLQKYAIFSKVVLSDVSDTFGAIGLLGQDAEAILRNNDYPLPAADNSVCYSHGVWLTKLANPLPRYLLIGSKTLLKQINSILASPSIDNDSTWALCDIAQGLPLIYQATRDQFTPHMLNYMTLGGVSLDKGCYIGQEIIARTHYRGQVKQTLQRAQVATATTLVAGDKIVDQNQSPIGTIINATIRAPGLQEVLAVLPTISATNAQDIYVADTRLDRLPLRPVRE